MENEIKETMTSEQAADFAALNASANAAELEAQTQQGEIKTVDLTAEISGAFLMVVTTLKPMLPSLGEIYTDQTIGAASGAIAGVCNKHGWLQGGMFGEYGEELAAAVILLPLAYATSQGVKNDIATAKAKAQNSGQTVTIKQSGDLSNVVTEGNKSVIIGAPSVVE